MLAGSPAKLIMEGVQRVENVRTENMLKVFLKRTMNRSLFPIR